MLKIMWWILFLMLVRGEAVSKDGTCEPIQIEMCRGLGYNLTAMPNLVGNEMQSDAEYTLQTFNPLLQYGCSAQLQLFLCSVYVPMCTDKVPSPIGPCRGLCEQVRARCNPVLVGFGFPWPTALDCSKFPPQNGKEHMCMEGPGEPGPVTTIQTVGVGNGPWGCSAYANSGKYIFLNRSGRCAPTCEADILWSQRDKHAIEAWITTFVVICLFSCVSAILTILKPQKQRIHKTTGESAIAYLTICHAAVGIGFLIRLIAGRKNVACQMIGVPFAPHELGVLAQQQYLTQDGLANSYCSIVFLLLYYFGSAASVWWVVLCVWWFQAARKWIRMSNGRATSNDGFGLQQGCSTVGAVVAWGFPAVHTIAVLVTRDVDADELTGSCFVGQQKTRSLLLLVLAPQLIYFTIGSTFLLLGLATITFPRPSINKSIPAINTGLTTNPLVRQRELRSPIEIQQRQKLQLIRLGTFGCYYALIMIGIICVTFYEWWGRDSWLRAPEPSAVPKVPTRPQFQLFVLKIIFGLGGGAVSAAWIWWPSLISILRKLSPCKQSPYKSHPPHALPVMHCYTPTSTNSLPHQIHHLGHIPQPQGHLHQHHQRSMSLPHRSSHKKIRKHRKYHSGSETQV